MTNEAAPVAPGDVLAGKYRVERVLGVGGMGVVVAATHLDLGQRVALKFLLPAALQNAEAGARFLREARAAVKIESEHVARVIDVGRLESGAPYMVMEYLDGHDLSDAAQGSALGIEDAVDYVLQACEAMAVAHTLGIVHRDLKPANLFLAQRPDGSPVVKVLDFGISKVTEVDTPSANLTHTSAVMGSPLYMSPEQMRSARFADARSDIWALGTILYELLAGEPPFNGETLGEVFAAVMTSEPRPLRSLRAEVPEALDRAVMRALEKDPVRRFPNVGEFAAALGEFAPRRSQLLVERVSAVLMRAGVSVSSIAIPLVPAPPESKAKHEPAPGATNTAWEDVPGRNTKPSRAPLAAIASLLLVGGLVGAVVVLRGGPSPTVSAERAPTEPAAAVAAAVAIVPATASTAPTAPSVAPASAPIAAAAPTIAPASAEAKPLEPAPAPIPAAKSASHSRPAPHAPPPPHPSAPTTAPPSAPTKAPAKNPLNMDFK